MHRRKYSYCSIDDWSSKQHSHATGRNIKDIGLLQFNVLTKHIISVKNSLI